MGRTPSPRTIAIRDRILAILRANDPLPMSTPEVLRAMANRGTSCDSHLSTDGHCPPRRWAPYDPQNCQGWCWHGAVYPQLRILAHLGLVEHIKVPGHLCVYWRYIDQESDAYFNAAIAAMEDSNA
jgi:hypothetical protein